MSEILDHVSNLSQSIGPRPAGTEEEQQAALYLAEALQKEAGLSTNIEDFNFNPNYEIVRAACCVVSVLMAILAVFLPVMVIPATLIALIAAVLFGLEVLGKPVVSNLFSQGISQNVVARYQPTSSKEGASRRRKVILVARYDSGKVRRDLSEPVAAVLPVVRWAELGGMVALPILTLIRLALPSSGAAVVIVNVLVVVAAILALLPFVGFIARRLSPYNEAANCNAAGVAVMTEVATRLGRGFAAEEAAGEDVSIHGESEARASGYVPEGADLVYENQINDPSFADESPEARLLAAKAAVAALSGKPVSNTINIDISSNLVQVKEPPLSGATAESMLERREQTQAAFAQQTAAASSESDDGASALPPDQASGFSASSLPPGDATQLSPGTPAGVVGSLAAMQQSASLENRRPASRAEEKHDVPDWFKAAQKKAKKTAPEQASPSQRSRYAGALDAAEREIAAQAQSSSPDSLSETEQRLQQMRSTILASQPPCFEEAEMREVAEAGIAGESRYEEEPAVSLNSPSISNPQVEANSTPASAELIGEEAAPSNGAPSSTVAFSPVGFDVEELRREMEAQKKAARDEARALDSLYPKVPGVDNPDVDARASIAASIPSIAAEGNPSGAVDLQGSPAGARSNSADDSSAAGSEAAAATSSTCGIPANSQRRGSRQAEASVPQTVEARVDQGSSVAEASSLQVPASSRKKPTPRKKRSISLPSLTGSLEPIGGHHKQDAPLAQDAELSSGRSSSLRRSVPSMGGSAVPSQSPSVASKESLRASLPSLSGIIREQNEIEDHKAAQAPARMDAEAASSGEAAAMGDTIAINVNQAGTFAPVGATGAFAPIGDELLDDVDPNDVYVDDADDSAYESQYTETGAFAGPGYVDMPKSRASRFFGRFRSKKKQQREETTQEWLDVDDSFDAQSVGRARGGWESFRNDAAEPSLAAGKQSEEDYAGYDGYLDDGYDDEYVEGYADGYNAEYDNDADLTQSLDQGNVVPADAGEPALGTAYANQATPGSAPRRPRTWNGGAFSRESLTRLLGQKKKKSSEEDDFYEDEQDLAEYADVSFEDAELIRQGGSGYVSDASDSASEASQFNAEVLGADDRGVIDQQYDAMLGMDEVHAENIQRIYGFRHADVTTEVWFVALGAQLASSAGMKAFISEHADDLRGAVVIELDGLGAGDLSLVEREGSYRAVTGSSRMKRYVRKASVSLGMEVGSAQMRWADGAAACAIRHGYQAMHLAGMRKGKPAFFGEAEDVAGNVDEGTMLANADFVMEILKNV